MGPQLDEGSTAELVAQSAQPHRLLRLSAGQRGVDRPCPLRGTETTHGLVLDGCRLPARRLGGGARTSAACREDVAGAREPNRESRGARALHPREGPGRRAGGQDDAEADLPQLCTVARCQCAQLDRGQARAVDREVAQTRAALRQRQLRTRRRSGGERGREAAPNAHEDLALAPELSRTGEGGDGVARTVDVECDSAGDEVRLDGAVQMPVPLQPPRRRRGASQLGGPRRPITQTRLHADEHRLVPPPRAALPRRLVGRGVREVARGDEVAGQQGDAGEPQLRLRRHERHARGDELLDRPFGRGPGLREQPQVDHGVGVLGVVLPERSVGGDVGPCRAVEVVQPLGEAPGPDRDPRARLHDGTEEPGRPGRELDGDVGLLQSLVVGATLGQRQREVVVHDHRHEVGADPRLEQCPVAGLGFCDPAGVLCHDGPGEPDPVEMVRALSRRDVRRPAHGDERRIEVADRGVDSAELLEHRRACDEYVGRHRVQLVATADSHGLVEKATSACVVEPSPEGESEHS